MQRVLSNPNVKTSALPAKCNADGPVKFVRKKFERQASRGLRSTPLQGRRLRSLEKIFTDAHETQKFEENTSKNPNLGYCATRSKLKEQGKARCHAAARFAYATGWFTRVNQQCYFCQNCRRTGFARANSVSAQSKTQSPAQYGLTR